MHIQHHHFRPIPLPRPDIPEAPCSPSGSSGGQRDIPKIDGRPALDESLMEEIEDLPAVQAAMDKRDQAQRQFGPAVEDLQDRISKIKGILVKYKKMDL